MSKRSIKVFNSLLFVSSLGLVACDGLVKKDSASTLEGAYQETIHAVVEASSQSFENIFSDEKIMANMSTTEYAQAFLQNNRFLNDGSGYLFLNDVKGNVLVHGANENFNGLNLYDNQDVNGVYYVREIIKQAKADVDKFVEYVFYNPSTAKNEIKKTYAHTLSDPNMEETLILGSGYYLESDSKISYENLIDLKMVSLVDVFSKGAAQVLSSKVMNSKSSQENYLENLVDDVDFYEDESGYLFILNTKGMVIGHGANDSLVQTSLFNAKDTSGTLYVQDMIALVSSKVGGGFVSYRYLNPASEEIEDKVSYVRKIEGTDYFVGTGVYR